MSSMGLSVGRVKMCLAATTKGRPTRQRAEIQAVLIAEALVTHILRYIISHWEQEFARVSVQSECARVSMFALTFRIGSSTTFPTWMPAIGLCSASWCHAPHACWSFHLPSSCSDTLNIESAALKSRWVCAFSPWMT